jgi:hypothetical protein
MLILLLLAFGDVIFFPTGYAIKAAGARYGARLIGHF